jgi:uracil-DNA glycosylase family 4
LLDGAYEERANDSLRLAGAAIVNAVRCLPPQNKPTPQEIATCRPYYSLALDGLPRARVLVALGQIELTRRCRSAAQAFRLQVRHLAEHRRPDGGRMPVR